MRRVNELVSSKIGDYITNYKTWGTVMFNVLENGLIGDGVTNDTAALQTLINTAISEGRKAIYFPHTESGGRYYVTAVANANQVVFFGDNAMFIGGYDGSIDQLGDWASDDKVTENEKYAKYMWGMEYLAYYHEKLRTNQAVKNIWSGDSTTFGVGITDPKFLLDVLSTSFLNNCGISSVTSINSGHSNKQTSDWVNNYLAEDMVLNPDLYIIRWGFNDGSLPVETRLSTFKTKLREGLTTIRSTKSADQLSIILMMPNGANDDTYGRNAEWFEAMLPVVKQAARDFQCCFIDTYTYLLDSANVLWQDTPMSDGGKTRIHPLNVGNTWIVSMMAEALIPTSIRNYGVTNVPSTTLIKSVTEAPSTYPFGISLHRTDGSAPYNGEYFTFRSYDGILTQINTGYTTLANEAIVIRRGFSSIGVPGSIGSDAWAPWIQVRNSEPYKTLTPSNGWTNLGSGNATAAYCLDADGNVQLKGVVTGGTTTTGTTIITLPVGYRPLQKFYHDVITNGSWGLVQVNEDGTIKTVNVNAAWVDFNRIIFKAEQ